MSPEMRLFSVAILNGYVSLWNVARQLVIAGFSRVPSEAISIQVRPFVWPFSKENERAKYPKMREITNGEHKTASVSESKWFREHWQKRSRKSTDKEDKRDM